MVCKWTKTQSLLKVFLCFLLILKKIYQLLAAHSCLNYLFIQLSLKKPYSRFCPFFTLIIPWTPHLHSHTYTIYQVRCRLVASLLKITIVLVRWFCSHFIASFIIMLCKVAFFHLDCRFVYRIYDEPKLIITTKSVTLTIQKLLQS